VRLKLLQAAAPRTFAVVLDRGADVEAYLADFVPPTPGRQ
jgi:hypothetical protein